MSAASAPVPDTLDGLRAQNRSYRALCASLEAQMTILTENGRKYHEAVTTLDSEREANAKLTEENERLREALTPHGETKYAYMGEFSWTEWLPDQDGIEQGHERVVPWTTIKEIMAAIRERAGADKLDAAARPTPNQDITNG